MSHGTETALVSCNEKKNWEILPFMCDHDESQSLVVKTYAEKLESFGEIRHSISCRDCIKILNGLFKNSPRCFKFRGFDPVEAGMHNLWHCPHYRVLLLLPGESILYPLCETDFIVTYKGVAVLLLLQVACLSRTFVFFYVVSPKCIRLISKSCFFLSDFDMSCCLLFHATCVISNCAFLSLIDLLLSTFFTFLFLSLSHWCAVVFFISSMLA